MGSLQLEGKVILITGALGQAGRPAVSFFLEKGASIAACDIKPIEEFIELTELQQQYGNERLLYVQANAMEEDQVINLMDTVEQYFGKLDGTYHNVYVNKVATIADQSLADWENSIRGTMTSAFLLFKYAAPLISKSGGGSMVSNSSIMGSILARAKNAGYAAGKAGLEQLTRIAAIEYAKDGIRVNAVVPGDFKSLEAAEQMGPEHMKNSTLIGRTGRPNEINAVAAFLLSDEASYVTGSMYPVNGGLGI